ncbi:hypothetical protein KDL45_16155, partial [bacterium]|nr:hypothetical protein [bacterium]
MKLDLALPGATVCTRKPEFPGPMPQVCRTFEKLTQKDAEAIALPNVLVLAGYFFDDWGFSMNVVDMPAPWLTDHLNMDQAESLMAKMQEKIPMSHQRIENKTKTTII